MLGCAPDNTQTEEIDLQANGSAVPVTRRQPRYADVAATNLLFSPYTHHLDANMLFRLYLIMFCVRVGNALMIQTMFDPDEYWQSLEIAFRVVFGRGYQTWEWEQQIRGYAHPFVFVCVYRLIKWCNLQDTFMLVVPCLI